MNILDRFFKGRQQTYDSFAHFTLKTEKELSEEQKQKILSIARNNWEIKEPAVIAIAIMQETGIYEPIIFIRDGNSVEVHI